MSEPWDDLAARISEPEGTNIYPALAEGIVSPAMVIAPDEPWIESSGFDYDTEHYLVICMAEAATPADSLAKIHAMVHAVRNAGGDGWEIHEASAVRSTSIPDDGTRFLGSWVRVSYRDCTHQVEEGS